jgi:tetratricopeptide (TPR) repeat protein
MRVFLTFLRILVWPVHQNLDYDYPASSGLLSPPLTLVGLSAISGIIFLITKLRRSFPVIAFGLAWMLITFSANLAPRANVIFEHKLYLISFGFFLAFVGTLSLAKLSRRTLFVVLWCIVALLAGLSFQRNKVWSSDLSLWEDAVRESPHKARPNNNFGFALDKEGRHTQALVYLNRAIAISPRYADAYNNRGMTYYHQGNFTQAVADYNQAIALRPNWAEVYVNRGAVFASQGNFAGAMTDYNKAIALNPNRAEGYNNRGNAFVKQKMYPQAISDFNKAVEIDPSFAQAYNNRAVVFYQLKEYAKAWNNLRKAKALGYAVNLKFLASLLPFAGPDE